MPKNKRKPTRKQVAVTVRLPPQLEKRLKNGIDACVKRFEKGLSTIKPTLNQLVVDAISRQLDVLDKQLRPK